MINADPQNEMDVATAGPAHCPYCLLAEPPSVLPRQTSTTAKHCMGRRAEIAMPKVRTERGAPKICAEVALCPSMRLSRQRGNEENPRA